MIDVKNLKRVFKSIRKEAGFKGAWNALWRPEYIYKEALQDISFHIPQGQFVGLLGANGAGKTTLLKILSGLMPVTQGRVLVMGEDPFDRSLNFRKKIALVLGQKAQLWWDLPAQDAFDLLAAIYELDDDFYRKKVKLLTEMMGVDHLVYTQIRRLSLGERMKMELIGALLHSPEVLFLDEPTLGLDIVAAQNLRDFLYDLNAKESRTVILTSHNMDDIERLSQRILLLSQGNLIFDGTPQELLVKGQVTRNGVGVDLDLEAVVRAFMIEGALKK